MKTVSKFSLVLILAGLTAVGISSLSQATPTSANDRLDRLAGGWIVEAKADGQPAFPGLISFSADGSVLSSQQPIGSSFETPGYGNWIATSRNEAAYTFVALFSDKDGNLVAKAKVVGRLHYDPRTDTWSGPYKIHVVFAADGVDPITDRGMLKATRITVETLD